MLGILHLLLLCSGLLSRPGWHLLGSGPDRHGPGARRKRLVLLAWCLVVHGLVVWGLPIGLPVHVQGATGARRKGVIVPRTGPWGRKFLARRKPARGGRIGHATKAVGSTQAASSTPTSHVRRIVAKPGAGRRDTRRNTGWAMLAGRPRRSRGLGRPWSRLLSTSVSVQAKVEMFEENAECSASVGRQRKSRHGFALQT